MIKPQMYANLHNHSVHSDGVYTADEITDIAQREGYAAMALTDHDTVTGNKEMAEVCKRKGMGTVFGCEFMCRTPKYDFLYHLVAFDFDPEIPEMKEYLRRCSATITEKTRITVERAHKAGALTREISWDDVLADNPDVTWFCNDHVFRSMKKRGLAIDKDYPAFFDGVFGTYGRDIPTLYEKLPMEELVPLIRKCGGIVGVAHPHKQLHTLPYLKSVGVEGIEVWHPDLTSDEVVEALKIAKSEKLYIAGGMDHSGLCGGQYPFYEDYKSCPWYVDEMSMGTTKELFEEIKSQRLSAGREELIGEYLEYYASLKKA